MKLTNENFQLAVKVGGLVSFLSTFANVYLLLRHYEVFRDASRTEMTVQREGAQITMRQQLLDGLIREFGARAQSDPGIAAVFDRYRQATNAPATKAQP